ncbi:hypothetical protein CSKR_202445 [Clonorchis sinensis]|uniref:Uncharacterized protein n=1 Tax=Clonorchis sinensis TaxID=79923 RepID=A0A8T1MWF6_CLOSI|nr:hypothetical protein CSKR_202445 [Clonorchis sinensis]
MNDCYACEECFPGESPMQNIKLTKTRGLHLPDAPEVERRNRWRGCPRVSSNLAHSHHSSVIFVQSVPDRPEKHGAQPPQIVCQPMHRYCEL